MLILGAHMSIVGGFSQAAAKTGEELGCNAMQIFTKSPRGRAFKPIDPEDAEQFKKLCQQHKIFYVVAHSSYLLNFGKPIKSLPWMMQDISMDFERIYTLGGKGIVIHIGKSLAGDRQEAITNVIENAKLVIDETQGTDVQYILENTAGQGSEIGFEFEELGQVWKGLRGFSPRIRSCFDTAHGWAAGYDLATPKGVQETMKLYDELVGIKTLSCFHFNDSKKERNSHLDRHENIGEGFIDKEGLSTLAKFAEEHSIPMILETPEKDGKTHLDDVKTVREYIS